jgi:hypothetical protein
MRIHSLNPVNVLREIPSIFTAPRNGALKEKKK